MTDYQPSDPGDDHYYVTEVFAADGATSGQVYSSGRLTLKESKIKRSRKEEEEEEEEEEEKRRRL